MMTGRSLLVPAALAFGLFAVDGSGSTRSARASAAIADEHVFVFPASAGRALGVQAWEVEPLTFGFKVTGRHGAEVLTSFSVTYVTYPRHEEWNAARVTYHASGHTVRVYGDEPRGEVTSLEEAMGEAFGRDARGYASPRADIVAYVAACGRFAAMPRQTTLAALASAARDAGMNVPEGSDVQR